MPVKQTALTAIQKMELSQLDPRKVKRSMMGDDLDLDKLNVYLRSQVLFDTTSRVLDIQVNRTIDGASTVDLTCDDYDRSLLRSGALNTRLDIEIDGLWFRLVKVSRSAGEDQLTLTFEQREIALLRTYPRPGVKHNGLKWASRDKTTRAEFILNLIREVREFKIPVVIPELHKVQDIEKATDAPTIDWGIAASGGTVAALSETAALRSLCRPGPGGWLRAGGTVSVWITSGPVGEFVIGFATRGPTRTACSEVGVEVSTGGSLAGSALASVWLALTGGCDSRRSPLGAWTKLRATVGEPGKSTGGRGCAFSVLVTGAGETTPAWASGGTTASILC